MTDADDHSEPCTPFFVGYITMVDGSPVLVLELCTPCLAVDADEERARHLEKGSSRSRHSR
ncbi:MAG: hypothetical protein MUE55_07570 [Thermoplasmata archaeon]|jgi:hypothetical protein|nr:hypothetical protein [Thermoplasmata archaeon]